MCPFRVRPPFVLSGLVPGASRATAPPRGPARPPTVQSQPLAQVGISAPELPLTSLSSKPTNGPTAASRPARRRQPASLEYASPSGRMLVDERRISPRGLENVPWVRRTIVVGHATGVMPARGLRCWGYGTINRRLVGGSDDHAGHKRHVMRCMRAACVQGPGGLDGSGTRGGRPGQERGDRGTPAGIHGRNRARDRCSGCWLSGPRHGHERRRRGVVAVERARRELWVRMLRSEGQRRSGTLTDTMA